MAVSFRVGGDQAYKTSAAARATAAFAPRAVREISSAAATLMKISPAVDEHLRGVAHRARRRSRARSRRRMCRALQRRGSTASRGIEAFPEGKQRDFPSEKTTRQSEKSDFSLGNAFFLQ
jgi:hypothetical protein